MSGHTKIFEDAKAMCSSVKYNEIWSKIKNIIKKKFGSDPVLNSKYLWTKIKFCNNRATTNFHDKVPKKGPKYICMSLIMVDSIFKLGLSNSVFKLIIHKYI